MGSLVERGRMVVPPPCRPIWNDAGIQISSLKNTVARSTSVESWVQQPVITRKQSSHGLKMFLYSLFPSTSKTRSLAEVCYPTMLQ